MIDFREKIWELSGGEKSAFAQTYKKAWDDLGGNEHWQQEFKSLAFLYWEHHRAYHRLAHPIHMLDGFHRALKNGVKVENPTVFPLAIWYHDADYLPWLKNKENERRSADRYEAVCVRANRPALIAPGRALIMATATHEPESPDERLIVDLDLMILGMPELFYDLYMQNIRTEYSFVPPKEYCVGRMVVLDRFLARANACALFHHHHFEEQYGPQAIKNLEKEIGYLRAWKEQSDIAGIC